MPCHHTREPVVAGKQPGKLPPKQRSRNVVSFGPSVRPAQVISDHTDCSTWLSSTPTTDPNREFLPRKPILAEKLPERPSLKQHDSTKRPISRTLSDQSWPPQDKLLIPIDHHYSRYNPRSSPAIENRHRHRKMVIKPWSKSVQLEHSGSINR